MLIVLVYLNSFNQSADSHFFPGMEVLCMKNLSRGLCISLKRSLSCSSAVSIQHFLMQKDSARNSVLQPNGHKISKSLLSKRFQSSFIPLGTHLKVQCQCCDDHKPDRCCRTCASVQVLGVHANVN